ncbi:hypothetical protein [Alteromonas australica]|uniref:Uncharacterized protein n=1 Tax=Alteromonas australica TaxID=589873 RepID=A0A075NXZ0_9ALTE|nr:hypothetical protein [Alteromonas australica]AIF98278.1 hypothetical protein EP13_05950 [Alteromonas australica]
MAVEYITAFKDVCLSIAAITTAFVAISGLKSWRKELRGKADFEVARGLIRATYKLRDELTYSRSPFTSANEFPEGYDPLNKTPEKEAEAWAYIFTNRWKPISDAVQEFEAQTLEAEALWSKSIKDIAFELRRCSRTLRVAMEAMVSNTASDNEDFKSDSEFGEKIKSEIWQGWGGSKGNDELGDKILTAVENIEKELRPHLKRN